MVAILSRTQCVNIFIQENAFENVVRTMAAILSRPQCVNGLLPVQDQANTQLNDDLSIRPSRTSFSEISFKLNNFYIWKMYLIMLSERCRPFCSGFNASIVNSAVVLYTNMSQLYQLSCYLPDTFLIIMHSDLTQHIEGETKWPPFRRWHFQMCFLEWKYMNFA